MDQEFLEKNESLVVEMGKAYLNKMEIELGKKYKNNEHNVNPGLTAAQFMELKANHKISNNKLNEIYDDFLKLKPSGHLKNLLDAFYASGGNVDIEPSYDEDTQKLKISVQFVIKDTTLKTIEGLSPLEDILVKMNAILQIDAVLSDPETSPTF